MCALIAAATGNNAPFRFRRGRCFLCGSAQPAETADRQMRALTAASARAVCSKAKCAKREADQIRPCSPIFAGAIRHGAAASLPRKPQACPKDSPYQNRRRYAAPPLRSGTLRQKACSFGSCGCPAISMAAVPRPMGRPLIFSGRNTARTPLHGFGHTSR